MIGRLQTPPVRFGQSTRPRRAFELKTGFRMDVTAYPTPTSTAELATWQATVYPRAWKDGPGGRLWETIVDDDATFVVHDLASATVRDYKLYGDQPIGWHWPKYLQGRGRDFAIQQGFTPPHDRGSYGWAELNRETNLWEVVWLEPRAYVICGKYLWGNYLQGRIGLETPVRVVYPPGGVICDQDPLGAGGWPFEGLFYASYDFYRYGSASSYMLAVFSEGYWDRFWSRWIEGDWTALWGSGE